MHIVYLIIFSERLKNKIYPCYYIGSKSNGTIVNNTILDKGNKEYIGSSSYNNYAEIYHTNLKEIFCLYETSNYKECISVERYTHILYDVVADIRFFNRSIAAANSFSNPEYGTYRHSEYSEYRRLPIDHPLVKNKTWVGVTKNRVQSAEERLTRGRAGELNAFYGKSHTQETINENKIKYQEWLSNNPDYFNVLSARASKTFSGKPKSSEQRRKMSDSAKGYITLKNIVTRKSIRIKRNSAEHLSLNLDEWSTTYGLREKVLVKCTYCNKEAMSSNTFLRWHFENCKHKDKINEG